MVALPPADAAEKDRQAFRVRKKVLRVGAEKAVNRTGQIPIPRPLPRSMPWVKASSWPSRRRLERDAEFLFAVGEGGFQLRITFEAFRCKSARGPDADRHVKLLIQFAVEGSLSGAYSQTAHPTAEWIANQLTQACGWEQIPRYLIRDDVLTTLRKLLACVTIMRL